MNSDEVKSNVTKLACIGLGYCSGRYHLSGDQVIAIGSDVGAAAAFLYGAYSHWGMKKVSETAKVIAPAVVLAALLLGFAPGAHAADMPTKAPPVAQSVFSGYPSGSGFYFGINSALATGKANAVDSTTASANSGSLVTQQGEVGATFGYTWGMAGKPVWFAVEGTFDFSNISGSNAGPLNGGSFSLSGPADFEQVFLMGAPWGTVTSALPSLGLSFPTLSPPPGLTGSTPNLYLFVGAYEQDVSANFGAASGRDWLIGFTSGVGARMLLSNAAAFDVRFEYRSPTQGECVSGFQVISGCTGLGPQYMARTAILF